MAQQNTKKRPVTTDHSATQIATYVPSSLVVRIDAVAKREVRKRAQMLRVLIEEALDAREKAAV